MMSYILYLLISKIPPKENVFWQKQMCIEVDLKPRLHT